MGFGFLEAPCEQQVPAGLQLELVVVEQTVGGLHVFRQGPLGIVQRRIRFGGLVARLGELRVHLNGLPVLDERFPVFAALEPGIARLEVLLLDDVGIRRRAGRGDEGRLVGIVSIGDLVKFRMDRIEQEAAQMLSYIQSA